MIAGAGIFFDMHGQSHPHGWIELGYAICGHKLDSGDYDVNTSTVKALANRLKGKLTPDDIIRGKYSFGGLLQDEVGKPEIVPIIMVSAPDL